MKQLFLFSLAVLLVIACKKSNIPVYHTKGDVYFNNHDEQDYTDWETYFDSVQYSFSQDQDKTEDSVPVMVRISGDTAGTDRPFTLIIDKNVSNAVEGKHYVLPESSKLFIPHGSVETTFYVKVVKSDDLLEAPVSLTLKVEPNEFFDTLMSTIKESYYNNVLLTATSYKIVIDNILPEPAFWEGYVNYFGDYSQNKYLLVLKVNDLTLKSDLTGLSDPFFKTIATKTQVYLNEQAASGNIIRESDGSPMTMGPDVQ